METYSVHVTQRSIGAGFIEEFYADGTMDQQRVIISEVLSNSKAEQLGLCNGDILIALNGVSVNTVDTYFCQKLPFHLTFQKAATDNKLKEHIKQHSEIVGLEKGACIGIQKLTTQKSIHKHIEMDKTSFKFKIYHNENITYLSSSNALESCVGYHQWSFKILQSDIYRQAIGIVSNPDIDSLTAYQQSARALYVNEIESNTVYYESYNDDGKQRCFKDLSNNKQNMGWNDGDIVKIYLDLERWKIKFYLNGNKVRKAISVAPNKIYYPIISFIGDCKYKCVN